MAPTAPRDLRIEVSKYTMWVQVYYNRPLDDGGTSILQGNSKLCLVESSKKLRDCKDKRIIIGSDQTTRWVGYTLEEETDYYVEINFRSDAYQQGPKEGLFFTTPQKCMVIVY